MNEPSFESQEAIGMCPHGNFSRTCKICNARDRTVEMNESANDVMTKMIAETNSIQIRPEDRNSSGELLASPNGNVSRLPEREWRMVRTNAFKEWFGQSLVLDENQEPLITYHGSEATFSNFNAGQSKKPVVDSGFFGKGNYFTEQKKLAETYGPVLYKTFLRIEKLQVFSVEHGNVRIADKKFPDEIHDEIFSRYEQRKQNREAELRRKEAEDKGKLKGWGFISTDLSNEETFESILSEEVTNVLKERGYDGVLGYNPISKLYEYVVFGGNDVMIIPDEIETVH